MLCRGLEMEPCTGSESGAWRDTHRRGSLELGSGEGRGERRAVRMGQHVQRPSGGERA